MQHKIGMFSATRNGRTFGEMMILAKDMGFSGIELFAHDDLETPDLNVAKRLADQAKEQKMTICCLSMGADLMAEDQARQVQRIKNYILVAKAAGVPYVHFTTFPVLCYDPRGIAMNRMIRTVAPAVRELCDFAGEHGVCCVVEGQGYYMNGTAPLAQLVEEVNHTNLGIVADLGNSLCVDEEPERFVGYFAPIIRHVHIKDMAQAAQPDDTPGVRWIRTRGGSWIHRTELGHGVVDLEKCLGILSAVGYDGWYSIENSYLDRLEQAAQDVRYFHSLLDRMSGKA